MAKQDARPSRNYKFPHWCKAKGFSVPFGYQLIAAGKLRTFKLNRSRYVTEEEDIAFDARTRANEALTDPERYREIARISADVRRANKANRAKAKAN